MSLKKLLLTRLFIPTTHSTLTPRSACTYHSHCLDNGDRARAAAQVYNQTRDACTRACARASKNRRGSPDLGDRRARLPCTPTTRTSSDQWPRAAAIYHHRDSTQLNRLPPIFAKCARTRKLDFVLRRRDPLNKHLLRKKVTASLGPRRVRVPFGFDSIEWNRYSRLVLPGVARVGVTNVYLKGWLSDNKLSLWKDAWCTCNTKTFARYENTSRWCFEIT